MYNLSTIIIIAGLILRLTIATINVEYEIFSIAIPDSLKFHEEGLSYFSYLKNESILSTDYEYKIGWIYGSFLGFFIITCLTFLLGSYLSCLFWFFSALIFRSIIYKLQTNEATINISIFVIVFYFHFRLFILFNT